MKHIEKALEVANEERARMRDQLRVISAGESLPAIRPDEAPVLTDRVASRDARDRQPPGTAAASLQGCIHGVSRHRNDRAKAVNPAPAYRDVYTACLVIGTAERRPTT
jgi:hypothetical protein